jgi:hypothetical protein
MRKLAVAMMVVGSLGLWANKAAAAAAKPPDTVSIGECKAKKAAVEFPHKIHVEQNKIDCVTCHHTNKDLKAGANQEVKKCSDCHLKPEKAETPTCTEMSPKKNPFHIKCLGCHQEKKDPKAPTKCADCHK